MSLTMTQAEREAFLADVHVGIVSVDDPGHGPLSVPVWYAYEPGGTVDVLTGGQSRKARHMRAAGRFTLCVQTETVPYCYVSVEGPITLIRDTVGPEERRQLAYRYLGQELGRPVPGGHAPRTSRTALSSACRPSAGSPPTSPSSSGKRASSPLPLRGR